MRHLDPAASQDARRAAPHAPGDAAAQEFGAEHACRGHGEAAGDAGSGNEHGGHRPIARQHRRQREHERGGHEQRGAGQRQRDGPAGQSQESERAGAAVARQRDARKSERQRGAGDREARRDELQHRGPSFRREAGQRIDAERLRERRREFDDECELQYQQRGQIERTEHANSPGRFERGDQRQLRVAWPIAGGRELRAHHALRRRRPARHVRTARSARGAAPSGKRTMLRRGALTRGTERCASWSARTRRSPGGARPSPSPRCPS